MLRYTCNIDKSVPSLIAVKTWKYLNLRCYFIRFHNIGFGWNGTKTIIIMYNDISSIRVLVGIHVI